MMSEAQNLAEQVFTKLMAEGGQQNFEPKEYEPILEEILACREEGVDAGKAYMMIGTFLAGQAFGQLSSAEPNTKDARIYVSVALQFLEKGLRSQGARILFSIDDIANMWGDRPSEKRH